MKTFKKLFYLLTPFERKRALLLLIIIIRMALLDMIGVASILPFMAVLTNPSLIETNFILKQTFQAFKIFGVENEQQFIFALGVLVFSLLIISLTFKAFASYLQTRFVQMCEYSIAKRLLEGYLYQPYGWFLSRNSADIGKTILSVIDQVIGNGINPFMELISKGIVTIALITLLVIADPTLTLIVSFSLGGAYGIIFYILKRYINRIGSERLKNNQIRFTTVSEAFGAIKELKLGSLEETYIKLFSNSAQIYARSQANLVAISQLPRFIIEIIAFGGILLMILYLISYTGNFNQSLPIISLYVFAGYRLMPALQQIYSSFTQITFVNASLNELYNDLKKLKPFKVNRDNSEISFNEKISLKNVNYNYPNSSRTALKDINLNIFANSTVGLVGVTGSGKTTVVDIILGLLEPKKGTLEVDGKIITKYNSRNWQQSIGYVPQHIFLADNTIESNIAFGVDIKNINQEAVEKGSKIANLHNFVMDELPNQYQTMIGERGIRLSGGQRQRIGIARALYHNPKILIFDEATSALDNQTEKAVMDAVNNLSKDITIILIAHRLNTVKNCDLILKFEKGQIISQGTFEELLEKNDNFNPTI